MLAVKKLSRYIRGSKELGIQYTKSKSTMLEGYSNSNYAKDRVGRVSILGSVFFLANGAVS